MSDSTSYNKLVLTATRAGAVVAHAELERAEGLTFGTLYPGGLYGDCSFFVPRKISRSWQVQPNDKIVISNGLRTVYEGYVVNPGMAADATRQGQQVTCLGAWGNILMQRQVRKPWADTAIDERAWSVQLSPASPDLCQIDRENRIHFTPKAEAWGLNAFVAVEYTAPTGQTIKRVTLDYDFQEGAQAWEIQLYNVTAAAAVFQITASGTGSRDDALATPATQIRLRYISRAAQTPTSDGAYYGEFSNIVVYTETGSINLTEIATDVNAMATELSTDTGLIASNTLSLVPFVADPMTYADILTQAASYGDSSNNPWACGVRASRLSSDNKPVLFVEQQPVLTASDYYVSLSDPNMGSSFSAEQDISTVRNWIAIGYTDEAGKSVWLTPTDDATLTDTTSSTAYGRRDEWLTLDTTDATLAANYAKRYLAQHKDPQWTISGSLVVRGYIRDANGRIPTSQIEAGRRVKIEDFYPAISGSGLTMLITQTQYNDSDETCSLTVGKSNSLDTWLANFERLKE